MPLLGDRRFVLEQQQLVLVPPRLHRRGRTVVTVPYAEIAGIENVDPRPGEPGTITLRLRDGNDLVTSYPRRALLQMRSTRHQVWKQVRAAR